MKKETLADKLVCLFWVFIGSIICAFGIQMTLLAGVGVDPITMFEEGVFKVTGISVGTVTLLLNLFVLTVGFFIQRDAINWGSVVCTFSVGPFINVWAAMGITAPESFLMCVLLNILGVAIIGFGISVYMLPAYGIGGMEAIMLFLVRKLKTPMGPTRIVQDCVWGVIGLLLGGTWGIGTVVGAFGIGMFIQIFYTRLCKLIKT